MRPWSRGRWAKCAWRDATRWKCIDSQTVRIGAQTFHEGDYLSVNGSTGNVYGGDIPVVESEVIQVLQGKMDAREVRKDINCSPAMLCSGRTGCGRLNVRANADMPDQATIARSFGAEGIGLCRTEHMFFAEDRIPIMQKMILARKRRRAGKVSRPTVAAAEAGFHRTLPRDERLSGHNPVARSAACTNSCRSVKT